MTETDIKILLKRFYDGNTTLEEEEILSEFLLSNDSISSGLEADKKLFRAFSELKEPIIPHEFENNIETYIDHLDNQSRKTVTVWHSGWKKIAGVAAAAIILIASAISYNSYNNKQNDTLYISQEKVYTQAERALVLLSQNLNKGTSKVDVAKKKVDKVNHKVNEILNRQFQ